MFQEVVLSPLKKEKPKLKLGGDKKSAIEVFEETRRIRRESLYGNGRRENISPRRTNSKELIMSVSAMAKTMLPVDELNDEEEEDEDEDEEDEEYQDEPSNQLDYPIHTPTHEYDAPNVKYHNYPYRVEQARKRRQQIKLVAGTALILIALILGITFPSKNQKGEDDNNSEAMAPSVDAEPTQLNGNSGNGDYGSTPTDQTNYDMMLGAGNQNDMYDDVNDDENNEGPPPPPPPPDPIEEPTTPLDKAIKFLSDQGVTPFHILNDKAFTQHGAISFIVDEEQRDYHIDYTESPRAAQRFIERYVLIVLYYHFNGDGWKSNLNFLSSQDHCNWFWDTTQTSRRSLATTSTVKWGVECGSEGFITSINLSENDLRGHTIPNEMHALTRLETLHMDGVRGEYPIVLREMQSLTSLVIMNAGLSGPLPDWIGESMSQLKIFALGKNNLSGTVPVSISHLTNLEVLGLNDNINLQGSIDIFFGMSSLKALYLENNAFSGQLPSDDMVWPTIVEVDLSNNHLRGSLPASIVNSGSLAMLDLHNNLLSGTFPTHLFSNSVLKVLSIGSNRIEGEVPYNLAENLSQLEYLDLSFNRFSSMIPNNISLLTKLRYWGSSNNAFNRQNFPNVFGMTNLVSLSLKHNSIESTIPDFSKLEKLETLDLDQNDLTGTIPTTIGSLTNLKHLLLNDNELLGTIPTELGNLALNALLLDGNSLYGSTEAVCKPEMGIMHPIAVFASDCGHGSEGEPPEIDCDCCTTCCFDGDTSCRDFSWTVSIELEWEYGFFRK